MNFNYRDFFTHNDDTHIVKEELSIVDEVRVPFKDAFTPNAKAVWDMYQTENNEQKIADTLGINLPTVQKIIKICLMKFLENKTVTQISDETKITPATIVNVLRRAIPDWERANDVNRTKDTEEIYNLHKQGKSPEEIVKLINQNRKPYVQIKLDRVNLILKIVDIAKKQMENDGVTNPSEIQRQINHTFSLVSIIRLIKKFGIGEIKYRHKFTPEQDAFILYSYLQRISLSETARQFNMKFSTESNKLNIVASTIHEKLKHVILKSKSESEISEYALKLLRDYKNEYFSTVNIEDPKTKELLTHYITPENVRRKDPFARKKGKVDPTRRISGKTGNLEPNIHQTITTGEIPASGQLGKKSGAPINKQDAIGSL